MSSTPFRVVDDFLPDPDLWRSHALTAGFQVTGTSPIRRSPVDLDGWEAYFQWYPADDGHLCLVHEDPREWSALIYLGKGEERPGTGFFRHRLTGWRSLPDPVELSFKALELGFAPEALIHRIKADQGNPEAWERLFDVGARFNRMVMFPGSHFHGPLGFWGERPEDSRLTLNIFLGKRNRGEWCNPAPFR